MPTGTPITSEDLTAAARKSTGFLGGAARLSFGGRVPGPARNSRHPARRRAVLEAGRSTDAAPGASCELRRDSYADVRRDWRFCPRGRLRTQRHAVAALVEEGVH